MAGRKRRLLRQSADEAVRHLARQRVEEAQAAAARLDDDSEALHDFRVAVRRLRTLLRAWRELELVPRKTRRRLRDLARATNEARDLEVAVENLDRRREGDAGLAPARERLARRCARARAETVAEIRDRWPWLSARLRRALASPPRCATPAFATGSAQRIVAQRDALRACLEALRAGWQEETAHAARLAGKRLRYLLEPLTGEVPEAGEAVKLLKPFQDRLGHYHDLSVLLGLLSEPAVDPDPAAASVPPEGAVTLADGIRAERRHLAEALQADYLARPDTLLAPADAVARALDTR